MSASLITGHVEREVEISNIGFGGSIFFQHNEYQRAECWDACLNYIETCMKARPNSYWLARAVEDARFSPFNLEILGWVARARIWGKAAYLHAINCPATEEDIACLR